MALPSGSYLELICHECTATATLWKGVQSVAPDAVSSTSWLQFWIKSDTGITSSGTYVSDWADQSGNGRNLTEASTANWPITVSSALNGYPAIQFDGTNDLLSTSSATAFAVSTPHHWFCVVAGQSSIAGTLIDGDTDALSDGDVDELTDGETDGDSDGLIEGLTEKLGEIDGLVLGLGVVDSYAEGDKDALSDGDAETDTEVLAEEDSLRDTLADGDKERLTEGDSLGDMLGDTLNLHPQIQFGNSDDGKVDQFQLNSQVIFLLHVQQF